MSELPDKLWLRRGEVRDYLQISEQAMTKLIAGRVLVPKVFKGMTYAFYERTEVLKIKPEEQSKKITKTVNK